MELKKRRDCAHASVGHGYVMHRARAKYSRNSTKTSSRILKPDFIEHGLEDHARKLRETNWNYGLVARLGHWTVETLEKYYGKMDRKTVLEAGRKHLRNI